ncbi:MAG: DUF3089 domain-containing protein [Bacteroidetes bacterium]|nr:DUF3089 domain-containing protein [Bacteroidota bacterium]
MKLILFLWLCFSTTTSIHAGNAHPVRPDYSNEKFWIALPARHDIGDSIPPGCEIKEDEANANADVFYIHPTVYLAGGPWNGDLDDKSLNRKCDACVLFQATPFNACCKVYAPRYRQAILRAFTDSCAAGDAALDTAYSDVKKAFEYYLANYNHGRPIIVAGHSQGSYHAKRLLKEFFEGKPLLKQLVAAYAIGCPIPVNYFSDIPVGDSAAQTGCFITWNTVAYGTQMTGALARYTGDACVNPLTWRTDTTTAKKELHDGAVPFDFKSIDRHLVQACIRGNLLWITSSDKKHFRKYYHLGKIYHVSDVNFFYMDIRANAIVRVNAYRKKNGN